MSQFQSLLSMGDYASYVWSAYGIGCMLLVGHYWVSRRKQVKLKQLIRKWHTGKNHES